MHGTSLFSTVVIPEVDIVFLPVLLVYESEAGQRPLRRHRQGWIVSVRSWQCAWMTRSRRESLELTTSESFNSTNTEFHPFAIDSRRLDRRRYTASLGKRSGLVRTIFTSLSRLGSKRWIIPAQWACVINSTYTSTSPIIVMECASRCMSVFVPLLIGDASDQASEHHSLWRTVITEACKAGLPRTRAERTAHATPTITTVCSRVANTQSISATNVCIDGVGQYLSVMGIRSTLGFIIYS